MYYQNKEVVKMSRKKLEDVNVNIKIPIEDFDTRQLINIVNLIYSKQKLLNASLDEDAFYVSEKIVKELKENEFESTEQVLNVLSRKDETKGFSSDGEYFIFYGFEKVNSEDALAYVTVSAEMINHARTHKKIHAKLTDISNEKYTMRIWLNQIGLSGKDGKITREVMLKKLSGNSAFRTEESKEKWKNHRREKSYKD